MMSVDDFAAAVKAKHPEYESVDNAELTTRMLEKFPQYKDSVEIAKPAEPSFVDKVKDIGGKVIGAAMPELKTVAEAYNSPIGDKLKALGAVPYQGLRGIAEGTAALNEGPAAALNKASEAVKPDYKPEGTKEKVADFAASMIEPRALLVGELMKAAAPLAKKPMVELGKQATNLQEVLTGVDAENFQKLFKDPKAILSAPSSKETGKAFQLAKEAAGLTSDEERKLAINEGARKRIYSKVMEQLDNLKSNPQAELPKVADLLRAKKAGQLIAESNPSSAGLVQKEIHEAINPLLKQLAPDVYNTQQAVHLSKVKESLLNIFPHGKGMMNYFRVISMLGGSLFHGVGTLESPVIQAGLTLGTKGVAKAAESDIARQTGAAGLVKLSGSPLLQSLRDKFKNANNK